MCDLQNKPKFDIILQGGQSNALGAGGGPTDFPFIPDDDIYYLTPNMEIVPAIDPMPQFKTSGDFALRFATLYKEKGLLENGRKILIVRSAAGGTGFDDKRWRITDDLYLRMLKMTQFALDKNPKNRLVAFLWHQGENDLEHDAAFYHHHLTSVVNGVRSTFHAPRLPFICGDFCHDWLRGSKLERGWSEIMMGTIATCIDVGHSRCVMTYDLLSNRQKATANDGDTVHFCRDALRILGERYFAAYCDLIGQ